MKQSLVPELESLGLAGYEARIYAVLLQYSPASAAFVAKRCGLSRSSVYTTLHVLTGKGLVATTFKNGVKQFVASDLGALERSLTEERTRIEARLERFPALRELVRSFAGPEAHIPQVMLFEGQEGLKKAYLSLMRDAAPGATLRLLRDEFIWRPEWRFVFEPDWHDRIKRRKAEKSIVTRLLTNDSAVEHEKAAFYRAKKGLEQRFLASGASFDRFAYYVMGDRAIFLSFEEGNLVGLKIVNALLAANFRMMFDVLWRTANAGR